VGIALQRVVLLDPASRALETVPADALFALIGVRPHTEWLGATLQRDQKGFIITGRNLDRAGVSWSLERGPLPLETNMPGVFAVGDARQGSVERVASAVGEGASVVRYIHEHLAAPVACAPALPLT
jgi:thioredoxin reductase (NADPH)